MKYEDYRDLKAPTLPRFVRNGPETHWLIAVGGEVHRVPVTRKSRAYVAAEICEMTKWLSDELTE